MSQPYGGCNQPVVGHKAELNLSDTPEAEALQAKITTLQAHLQEAQKHIATLGILQEVARSLTSELNLDPLLRKILAAAVKVTNASAGSLLLLDELANELIFAVVEGGGGEGLQGVRISRNTGIAGWVATHKTPLIIDDVNQDNRYYQSIADTFDIKLTSLLCVPMMTRNKLIGVLQVVHTRSEHYFGLPEQDLLTTFASEAAIAIENARLYQNLKDERDKLVVVEDEIRKHLARDLHDGPTQFVSAIILSLSLVKELINPAPELALNEVNQTMSMAEQALKQLRTLLFDLRPVVLETHGLIPALELYTERLQETDNLNIHLNVEQEFERLTPKAEVAIFAIIQEAVNNAKKHAQAAQINLALQPNPARDTMAISITDNGIGFDVKAVTQNYNKRGSLGLINMQERTETINGTFRINSQVGHGTEVVLTLPLTENTLNDAKEK